MKQLIESEEPLIYYIGTSDNRYKIDKLFYIFLNLKIINNKHMLEYSCRTGTYLKISGISIISSSKKKIDFTKNILSINI